MQHYTSKLVIATSDTLRARRAIEIARALNPKVEILVRADSEEEANLIREGWADVTVFISDRELARNMAQRAIDRGHNHGAGEHP